MTLVVCFRNDAQLLKSTSSAGAGHFVHGCLCFRLAVVVAKRAIVALTAAHVFLCSGKKKTALKSELSWRGSSLLPCCCTATTLCRRAEDLWCIRAEIMTAVHKDGTVQSIWRVVVIEEKKKLSACEADEYDGERTGLRYRGVINCVLGTRPCALQR